MFFSETLDPELVEAASAAASTLPNRMQAESELLKQLRQHEAVTEAQKKGDMTSLGYVSCSPKYTVCQQYINVTGITIGGIHMK